MAAKKYNLFWLNFWFVLVQGKKVDVIFGSQKIKLILVEFLVCFCTSFLESVSPMTPSVVMIDDFRDLNYRMADS